MASAPREAIVLAHAAPGWVHGGLDVQALDDAVGDLATVEELRQQAELAADVIRDTGSSTDALNGINDTVGFLGLKYDQLWFSKSAAGDDLIVSQIGADSSVTVDNWFTNPDSKVEQFVALEGLFGPVKQMCGTSVQGLVDAMVGMTQPPMGQTTLSDAQRTQLSIAFNSTRV